MKTIKILVPTDFSDCALNAAKYALLFAKSLKGDIILFHSIIYNESTFINETDREEENSRRYNEANHLLNELIDNLKIINTEINLTAKIEGGPALANIETILESEKIDFVVMGTEGASGIKAALFGSYTTDLMKNSSCPILAIPSSASYTHLNNILCATEMHPSELPAIKNLIELAAIFKSKITFLNISDDNNKHQTDLLLFQEKIRTMSDYKLIDYKLEKSKDAVEVIENLACAGGYDLIVTLGRHRNFLDKIMGISVSRRLCLHNSVPILTFPHTDF